MERLTEWYDDGILKGVLVKEAPGEQALKTLFKESDEGYRGMCTLKAYEDTGLDPDQIRKLADRDTEYFCKTSIFDPETVICKCGNDIEKDSGFAFCPYCGNRVKYMNDGWIPVQERMPTKEECENNYFWVMLQYNTHPVIAKCDWIESEDKIGNDDSFLEFFIDQYPQIYTPSKDIIIAWKIADVPEPYNPKNKPEDHYPEWRTKLLNKFDKRL